MDNTDTTALTAAEALRAYGNWHAASCGYHIEVLHPVTGEWVVVSGGTHWSENDDVILGVFTGKVEVRYDDEGDAHQCPVFTHLPEDGAIAVKRDTVLQARNVR